MCHRQHQIFTYHQYQAAPLHHKTQKAARLGPNLGKINMQLLVIFSRFFLLLLLLRVYKLKVGRAYVYDGLIKINKKLDVQHVHTE